MSAASGGGSVTYRTLPALLDEFPANAGRTFTGD